ncbi:DUF4258 domain-containing protein [Methylocystis sp. S23]
MRAQRIGFTRHALERIKSRNLERETVIRAIEEPLWTESDPADASLTRFFAFSDETRTRMIRVVARVINAEEILVVTALMDRNARDKRPK